MIVIKVDTGFVGGIHETDTGLTQKEWDALTEKERADELAAAIFEHVEAYAEDDEA